MTEQQILRKAIKQAKDNGWVELAWMKKDWGNVHPEDIIFNHHFAKALWPNNGFKTTLKFGTGELARWQYNLAQMVIAENPIKYLGENL